MGVFVNVVELRPVTVTVSRVFAFVVMIVIVKSKLHVIMSNI